jgi:hypothetical protein
MPRRKNDFSEEDKVRVLLWCARHCCLCGKQTGIGIEVAHLDPKRSDIDNAIPLCFDCHAAIGHYNSQHPRGRKYSIAELRARRDQVYEQHTRHLVPSVLFELKQGNRKLPDVGFQITNLGNTYPARALILITLVQGSRIFTPDSSQYGGRALWNLNPGFGVNGHFDIAGFQLKQDEPLRARIDVSLVDIYERSHRLLPVGYIHKLGSDDDWYLEPSEEILAIPIPNKPEPH